MAAHTRRMLFAGRLCVVALSAVCTGSSSADVINWIDPLGGSFHDAGNWDFGVPGPNDEAHFDLAVAMEYPVTFAANAQSNILRILEDKVRFELGGFQYDIMSNGGGGWINVGLGAGDVAELKITGGTINATDAIWIGTNAGATGTLTLTGGANCNYNFAQVGSTGDGKLVIGDIIEGSATAVASGFNTIGRFVGSTGDVTVSRDSFWQCGRDLTVGWEGQGDLLVEGASVVRSLNHSIIGAAQTGVGRAIVTGSGSNWSAEWPLFVGDEGDGTLTVNDGGSVHTDAWITIANQSTGVGDVTVTGPGSVLSASSVFVGGAGDGTLTIEDSGTVGSLAWCTVGGSDPGSSGHMTVRNPGSLFSTISSLSVGDVGSGTLDVGDAATVFSRSGSVASRDGAANVTLAGAGSTWETIDWFAVGEGGHLTISNGAALAAGTWTRVAKYSEGTGTGSALVTGSGSLWTADSGPFHVGGNGDFSLRIENGGTVSSTWASIDAVDPDVATITVMGSASSFSTLGGLYIAESGNGAVLVENGGTLSSSDIYVATDSAGTGTGTLTLTGSGSSCSSTSLFVGLGGDGTMLVESGAQVFAVSGDIGTEDGSLGRMTVDGAGSAVSYTDNFDIGEAGVGMLTVSNGGTFTTDEFLQIGTFPTGIGSVTVTGPASTWTHGGAFFNVGDEGSGTLVIEDGGTVQAAITRLGDDSSGFGSVTVRDAGSTLTTTGLLDVGLFGTGVLQVSAGANVQALGSIAVANSASAFGDVSVRDPGSTINCDQQLIIGDDGQGTLTIENGAIVMSNSASIGADVTSSGRVDVDGPASIWTNTGSLGVGAGGTGTLALTNAASVVCDGELVVAAFGTGTLSIQSGGTVTTNGAFIGREAGSTGDVTIDGAGSTWTNIGSFGVGVAGAGSLALIDGGTVVTPVLSLTPQGMVTGDGTIDGAVNHRGILAPGNSAGTFNITGSITQDQDAVLEIEIGGLVPGTEHDRLIVGGPAVLDGTLIVTLINGFDPLIGDTFEIVDVLNEGTMSGEFDVTYLPVFENDDRFFAVSYHSGGVTLGVFGGGGDVMFDPPDETPAAGEPIIEVVGDFDNDVDGTPDVAVVIPDLNPNLPGNVQVFLNQGNLVGEWQGLVDNGVFPVGADPTGIAAGFFDNDLFLDLAVSNRGAQSVSLLINDGDGTFTPAAPLPSGSAPSDVTAADFNGDTFVDLAVSDETDNNVRIYTGDGFGNFVLASTLPTGGDRAGRIRSGDVDNDKDIDIDIVGINQGTNGVGSAFVLINTGGGVFAPVANYNVGTNPSDLSIGDLDRDDFADVVTVNRDDGTVSVLLNEGDGTFTPASNLDVGADPSSIDAVDLDGDLDLDLAVVADDPDIGRAVQVLRNTRIGVVGVVFEEPVAFGVGPDASPNFVANGDFNLDSAFDLVTVNQDDQTVGSVTVLLNDPCSAGCEVLGNAFRVIFGNWQEGTVTDLFASDDEYVVVGQRAGFSPILPVIRMQITGIAATETASQIVVTLETSTTAIPQQPLQKFFMLDYDAGQWQNLDERITTTTDSKFTITIDTNVDRFIDDESHAMAMQLDWFDPGGVFFPNWVVSVDQAHWTVTP